MYYIKDKMQKVLQMIKDIQAMSRKITFGELNPKKVFYVFRFDIDVWGIYSIVYNSLLDGLLKCKEKGYIPVIDMQNYRPKMLEDNNSLNLWEGYFSVPEDTPCLSEVYQSKNVILAPINYVETRQDLNSLDGLLFYNKQVYRDIFNKYIKVNKDLEEKINRWRDVLFPKSGKVLGIAIRECYRYVEMRYSNTEDRRFDGHPRVLTPLEYVKKIRTFIEENGYQYVFVVVDDRECLEILKDELKDEMINYDRPLVHYFEKNQPILDDEKMRLEFADNGMDNNFSKQRMEDYLIEIELLARCDSLMGSTSSGIGAALLRNDGKYEKIELFDLGKY